jgi:hypothetical protein
MRSVFLGVAIMAVAGCGSVSSMLGLERHVPDETQVVVRPALTLPPDYDLLPPGTPTPVSADHEAGQPGGEAGMAPVPPPKEEHGFFGRILHGEIFDTDDDKPPTQGEPLPDANETPSGQSDNQPAKTSAIIFGGDHDLG